MNRKNNGNKDNDDDDDDDEDEDDEENQDAAKHVDDNQDSDWPDLDHLISPDEHLNFVLTFNGNDGDGQSSDPPETLSPSSPQQQQQLGVNFGPMSEGLMDSVVSEPSRTTTATTTTTTATIIANGFGQQMFALSQTISHFMLCLGIVGSAFFITGTSLLMMVTDHIVLAVVCILLGCFSLCSSIIYFMVYFINECTQLIPTKQHKYKVDETCGHVQNHDNHQSDFEHATNHLNDETNCLSIQNSSPNPMVGEEQMTSLDHFSFLNVEDLDRVTASKSQKLNNSISKNQSNKQRTNIFESITFCGHKRRPSSSFTNAKSNSKSELLVNEYENENMLFDVDRIGIRRSSSLEILFDDHQNRIEGPKDDWKIVMKNGANGSNGSNSNDRPFMIVQFNKGNAI